MPKWNEFNGTELLRWAEPCLGQRGRPSWRVSGTLLTATHTAEENEGVSWVTMGRGDGQFGRIRYCLHAWGTPQRELLALFRSKSSSCPHQLDLRGPVQSLGGPPRTAFSSFPTTQSTPWHVLLPLALCSRRPALSGKQPHRSWSLSVLSL